MVTRDDHVRITPPEVVLEVMQDTTSSAHTTSSDDDRALGNTIDSHRTNLLRKLKVKSTTALVVKALSLGLVSI